MKFKSISFFLFVLASLIINFSCKEGVTEPHLSVLKTENIIKLQETADSIMRNFNSPALSSYIAVEGEGEFIITRGVGNILTGEQISSDNNFRIGTVTCSYITEVVLILAGEGIINLNKTISDYLPESEIPGADKITIRMLGNMTSGLFDYTENTDLISAYIGSNGEMSITADSIIKTASRHPLNFDPGSRYDYTNTNTVLLSLIITRVTGKKIEEVLNEKIFKPLKLENTFWPNTRYLPYPYSHGYCTQTGSLTDVTNWNPSIVNASGILVSNLYDLTIWIKELNGMNLISEEMKIERMSWIDCESGKGQYGFGVKKLNGWIGYSGIIYGYETELYYNPGKKATIIVTANSTDDNTAHNAFILFSKILVPDNSK